MATSSQIQILGSRNNIELSNASVFVTLDTSGSMAGAKINAVVASLHKIIKGAPPFLRFVIRVFNSRVETIVSKKKKYLDLARLTAKIKATVGNCTALYDAWIQTIDQIPYNCWKGHVIIFTDGSDNVSQKNLEDALNKTSAKIQGEQWHFTFVQVGNSSSCSIRLEVESLQNKNYTLLAVEDSAAGIRLAFEKIQKELKVQFNLKLSIDVGNKSTLLAAVANSKLAAPYRALHSYQNQSDQIPRANRPGKISEASAEKVSANSVSNAIWVGDIPLSESPRTIQMHFQKWGSCRVEAMAVAKNRPCQSQWAIVTFDTNEQAAAAVQLATKFNGIDLSVKAKLA